MKKELEQLTIKGEITATSNKQSDQFVVTNPRKTAYLKVDEDNAKKLKANGVTEYSSKDGETFFIVKLSESIDIWIDGENTSLDVAVGTPNFKTNGEVAIAMIKGYSKGNDFMRIFALGLKDDKGVELVEKENPFA